MRKQLAAILCLVFYFLPGKAMDNNPPHVTAYINSYFELAIQEMHRSGIPASVTLAQGIHESSWGLGELSINSMNHFGIKCKDSWTGKTFYIEDDDYQNGKLIKSCFRVYTSVEDSYIDHTNFLVQNARYEKLFTYNKTDYENWAKGLQSCGYATDKKYAEKLIRTIEKYSLFQYDYVNKVEVPEVIVAPVFNIPDNFSIAAIEEEVVMEESIVEEEGDDEYEEYEEGYEVMTTQIKQEVAAGAALVPAKNYTLEASSEYDHEVPTAVSIEDYKRNSSQQSYTVAPVVIVQEKKAIQKAVPSITTHAAPVYTSPKEGIVVEKAKLDTRVNSDNDSRLYQLRAKPRVSTKLRG